LPLIGSWRMKAGGSIRTRTVYGPSPGTLALLP